MEFSKYFVLFLWLLSFSPCCSSYKFEFIVTKWKYELTVHYETESWRQCLASSCSKEAIYWTLMLWLHFSGYFISIDMKGPDDQISFFSCYYDYSSQWFCPLLLFSLKGKYYILSCMQYYVNVNTLLCVKEPIKNKDCCAKTCKSESFQTSRDNENL